MSAIASTPIDAEAKNAPTSGRLFFMDLGAGRILSANPDGSDLKTIINEGRRLPDGLVLWSLGIGIPILLAGSRIRRGNEGPNGRRMSINVEVLGGNPMVQHYVEEIAEPHHLRLVSNSDIFTSAGRVKVGVIWDLSVKKIDGNTCEFTNVVHSFFTPELLDSLPKQGIPWEDFQAARKPVSEAHNRQETPLFAESIERHALRKE